MSLQKVLKKQIEISKPDPDALKNLKNISKTFIEKLEKELDSYKVQVFIGGSFAKGTLIKKEDYDVDIFVRFSWEYENISPILEKALTKVCKILGLKLEKLHGSRDYFKAHTEDKRYYLEIIPVTKIKKPHEERNVTDLSYFHVPYVKRKIKGLTDQTLLAKAFCHAQKVYGAESYIQGFSGYAIECLIIHYKSFTKMLRELSKIKLDRLVIDIEKAYKKKNDVFFEMNENKLHSPVILVDPTYKERNALASLSRKTFQKFQKAAKKFLKNPSLKHFIEEPINIEKLQSAAKRKKAEFISLRLKTNLQSGDIAGTKLKKFSEFLIREIEKYFFVIGHEFEYNQKQHAELYLILQSKKEIIRIGPPIVRDRSMRKHIRAFKQEHAKTYEKDGYLHAKIKIKFSPEAYIEVWKKANKKVMREMKISNLVIF